MVCANPAGPAYGPDDGIFTTMGLAPLRQRIMRLLTLRGGTALRAGCSIPVTFMLATDRGGAFQKAFTLAELRIPTSRRMTGFELRVVEPSPGNREIAVCDLQADRSDDVFVHLPSAAPSDPDNCRRLALEPVVDAILASAAAPPLQLPQPLTYCAESCEPSAATGLYCPVGTTLCQGRFSDGASFDHKPLAAAARVRQALVDLKHATGPTVSFVVIDADELRRPQSDPTVTSDPQPRGAAYISRQVGNFGKVIDDLELQMMSRYGQLEKVRLDRTTRYAPIVGATDVFESVPAFALVATGSAAFFDVDFRRYDYYVGLYDGIRWLAEQTEAYCRARPADDRGCVELGMPPRKWQDWVRVMAVRVGAIDKPAAATILNAVGHAEGVPVLGSAGADPCAPGVVAKGSVEARMCVIVRAWGNPLGAAPVKPDVADTSFARLAVALRKSGEYPGEKIFVDDRPAYVANYDQWPWSVARQALRRMEALERMDNSQGTAAAAAGAEFLTAVGAGRRTLKLGVGPSSVPDRFDTGSSTSALLAKLLIPSVLTDDVRHGGLRLGWEPLAYNWAYSRLFATAQFQWQRYPRDDDERYAVGGALGYTLNGARPWVPEVGVRAGTWYVWNLPGDKIDRFCAAAELFWRPLWGQAELYTGVRGSNCIRRDASGCSDTVVAGFGIADLNGLLYWLLRATFGSDDTYAWLGGQLGGKATSVIP